MKSESARALVFKEDNLLLIKVTENNYTHFVIPGGKKEPIEVLEETVIREVLEETNINVVNPRKLGVVSYTVADTEKVHTLFLCEFVSGNPILRESPEMKRMREDPTFVFQPMWVPLSQVGSLELTPKAMKELFVNSIERFKLVSKIS
jgi:ADP-ribose pyrophosphatase YjhB (NUDIX family)